MKRTGNQWWMFCLTAVALALLAIVAARIPARGAAAPAPNSASVDFVRDIQPIFASSCYKCHDAAKHKGGLRLDSKQTAFVGGDSGDPSLVPNAPDHSKIIQLVRGDDPNSVMPPKGKRLSAGQVDLLTRWVRQGAAWPDGVDKPGLALTHWSFSKPIRPALPDVKQKDWCINPIDRFVLAKLEQTGLAPAPAADRYTLCRRVYLDLIGIPPSPPESDAFVNDTSPDSYEKLVDRLLSNPHYGERWARMWLDCARYADSAGYGSDPLRKTCSRYRDWVIQAFNRDLPYDRFTIEQIAGDLLPHPTTDQLIATGFNRNTMTNTEGGTDPEEFRMAAVKDRVEATVQVTMGLTVGCAQCHTHKYDPITNREYYQLCAIFNQTEDANRADEAPTILTPTPEEASRIAQLNVKLKAAEAMLTEEYWADREAGGPTVVSDSQNTGEPPVPRNSRNPQREWEKSLAEHRPQWVALDPATYTSANGATLKKLDDGSILASGPRATTDTYIITTHTDLKNITAFRLEALPDPSLPHNGPGRGGDGGFTLGEFRVMAYPSQSGPPTGRYVRIELPGKQKILHLAEVQVFHGSDNIAPKGAASQSSVAFNGEAKLAIDGITDGDFARHPTAHTDRTDNPWWEVDLGSRQTINHIVLWNRTDNGLQRRLSNFRVLLLDEKREPVWTSQIASPPNPSLDLDLTAPRTIALQDASDDFHQADGNWSAAKAIDGHPSDKSGWAISSRTGHAHVAVFQTAAPIGDGSTTFTFTLSQKSANRPLGRFRILATTSPRPVRILPADVAWALEVLPANRSASEKSAVFNYFAEVSPQMRKQREAVAKLKMELDAIHPMRTAIMRELPPDKRRESHVLVKGNFLIKGPIVQPAVLAAFNPLPKGAPANRMGLALWIVDRDNPLTARVAVNRFWGQLFGTGIVETQEDFGTQGQPPSDQKLLDWLACEFQNPTEPSSATGSQASLENTPTATASQRSSTGPRPWDIKRLLRLMVTSSAYRQSSRVTPDELEKDPHNRLLSRGPRHRLAAEAVRDQALALSGLLSPKMFGPSVFPPQPDGLWQAAFNGERTYPTSTGEDRYRRGIYVFWRRTTPYPSMSAFDAPSREICTLRRVQTSTPLQAFVTLNDPVYVECAQALARRVIKEGGDTPNQRAAYALRLCLCHPAHPEQVARVVELYQSEQAHYRADAAAAAKMNAGVAGALPKGVAGDELAAWTVCANVLLNLDGVLTNN
ncbi:MAG TPA: DUF1553 domain-containing protein [Tepidisphaeraceae bacterium]|nr:DUF1553 domain-containing protein [Tepidisphaeraceae bacterium]